MKSISWQSISFAKVLRMFFTIALVSFWTACADDSQNLSGPDADAASASPKSYSSFGDYNISLSVTGGGTIWTYTITKAKANAKTLSHLILNLQNCGDESPTFNDIDYATINGIPTTFVNTEGSGTTCNPQIVTSNFVKITGFTAANSWVVVIAFDRGYDIASTTTGWVKAGTSCNTGTIPAPGCPISAYCSLSQGYYFASQNGSCLTACAGGSWNNGADDVWTAAGGLTIGGVTYNHTQGSKIWDANTGDKINILRAFFQLGALKLSNTAPAALLADMAAIETYFTGKDISQYLTTCTSGTKTKVCFTVGASANFPADAAALAAAGNIGSWIDLNHCPN